MSRDWYIARIIEKGNKYKYYHWYKYKDSQIYRMYERIVLNNK